jgi:hypothetical protein
LVLKLSPLDTRQRIPWIEFFQTLLGSQTRIWIAIIGVCIHGTTVKTRLLILPQAGLTFLISMYTTASTFSKRLQMNRWALVVIELLAMGTMAAAFAASLTLTVKLGPICASLATTPDLASFGLMCPADMGFSIAAGVGWLLIAITSITTLVHTCRKRQQKVCSFEPTASSLGMRHDYLAVQPPASRDAIPTIYDPQKPMPADAKNEEEIGFVFDAADMGKRDSRSSVGTSEGERDAGYGDIGTAISGPLGLQNPAQQKMYRPAHRPWSEMPKKKTATG